MSRRHATLLPRRAASLLASSAIVAALVGVAPGTTLAATTLAVPSAYATIQAAIDAAADGDTVVVAPGTYHERIDFGRKNVVVQSSGGASVTTIDGDGGGVVVKIDADPGESPTLRGFTVRNGASTPVATGDGGIDTTGGPALIENNVVTANTFCDGGAIEAAFSAATIRNSTITNNRQLGCSGGVGGGGVSIRGAGSVRLAGNVIDGNQHGSWAGAVSLFASGPAVIEKNVIRNNRAGSDGGAIEIVNDSPASIRNNLFVANSAPNGGAIDVSPPSGSSGAQIFNNTFVGNVGTKGSAILTEGFAQSVAIYDNIVVGDGPGGVIACDGTYSPNPPQVTYNDVVATSGSRFAGTCTTQDPNLAVAPTFVNAAAGDYHLAPGSAGIDAGTSAGAATDDIDGDVRPIDGDGNGTATVDMGYDEAPTALLAATIDILPGTSPNVVKLSGKGLTVSVALLSTPTLDARQAVASSLCFGDAEAPAQRDCTLAKTPTQKDLDRDGDIDVTFVFDTNQTGIDPGDRQACLTGRLSSGRQFAGCDSIVTR
jgi:hypothetical protein